MDNICIVSFLGNRYITRLRIDPRKYHPAHGHGRSDILIRRKCRWLLRHQYKHYLYEDQGSGHGKLTIFGKSLPETICMALYGSLKPASEVVEIPARCMLHGVDAQIISAKNSGKNVILRFRMAWLKVN